MGRVYRQTEVPIPEHAKAYGKIPGAKVYDTQFAAKNGLLLGYATSDTMMNPNTNYFRYYRSEYLEFDAKGQYRVCINTLKVGLFALTLSVAHSLGIYDTLVEIFGIKDANMIMDYVMFLITERENATYMMSGRLSDEVTFSGKIYGDSSYSRFFNDSFKDNLCRAFLDSWLEICITKFGMKDVYLTLDGSNDDCDSKKNELAECGKSKSNNSGPIIGFMCAVIGSGSYSGLPVTYFLNKGGLIDSISVKNIVEYFKSFNVEVKGVLCDRGFCDINSFLLFIDANIPYTTMLKSNVKGFKDMVNMEGNNLRDSYSLDNYLSNFEYGTTGFCQIFGNNSMESYITLLYDPRREGNFRYDFMKKISVTKKEIEHNIALGRKTSVPKELEKYMSISGEGNDRKVIINDEKIRKSITNSGFCAIATYDNMDADDVAQKYSYRNSIEKSFSFFKSQLGCDVLRVSATESAQTKFFTCYVASIVRYEIQRVCGLNNINTNQFLSNIGDFQYHLHNCAYRYSGATSSKLSKALEAFGITEDNLREFSSEITNRYISGKTNLDIYQNTPWAHSSNKGNSLDSVNKNNSDDAGSKNNRNENESKKPEKKNAQKEKKKIGRPKGSKNKKTLEREALEKAKREAPGYKEPEKGKAGRPKGSKDSYKRHRSTKAEMQARLIQKA